jgi:hypothetical protein
MINPALAMNGSRLEFVVVPLQKKIKRKVMKFKRGEGLVAQMRDEDAGFMVYFPRGHALRMTSVQLKKYRLNRKPNIINLEGLHDANSPVGRLMAEQDEKGRQEAYRDLEQEVIQMVTTRSGQHILTEAEELPEAA